MSEEILVELKNELDDLNIAIRIKKNMLEVQDRETKEIIWYWNIEDKAYMNQPVSNIAIDIAREYDIYRKNIQKNNDK